MSEKHPMIGGIVTEVRGEEEEIVVCVPNGKEFWIWAGECRLIVAEVK